MNKRFTKLIAALALFVFMTPSLAGWGQTRDEVVAYTLTPTNGSNNSYTGNCDIEINSITWNLEGNSQMQPWRIGGKSITNVDRKLYSKTAISDNISKIEVTHGAASSITINSWTVIVASDADFTNIVSTLNPTFMANSTTTINRPDGKDWSNCYYRFVYNVTVSGSSNKFLEFSEAKFYRETGTSLQDSDLTLSPTDLSFDLYDDADAKTIAVSTSSTGAITVSNSNFITTQVDGSTITVTPVAVTPEAQTITVSQAADNTYNAGEATFTVSIANSTPTYTVTYKANGGAGDDVVDTYYQGDDVTVRSNPFIYAGFAFTKWNTSADGTGTDYQPTAIIENIQANVELYAQWEESNEVVDVINPEFTGNPTSYTEWNNKQGISGAVYAGQSTGGTNYIQIRTQSPSGIVSTTSGGMVRKVVVTWHSNTASGRTLNVYGKNTAYTTSEDLYDEEKQGELLGTIVCGTSSELTVNGDYEYIGLCSAGNAMYLTDIRISWEPDNNPAVATTVTINEPDGFNTDIYQGTMAGTLTATVSAGDEPISGATVTWSSSDTDVATIDANGAVTLVAVGTTTITASYEGVENEYRPSSGSYELNVIDSNAPGTESNPYTVAQARAAIDAGSGTQGVYATGIVCTASSNLYNNKYLSYYISADGSTESDQLEAYNGLGLNGASFTSVDDVQVGDIVVIYGNLTKYNTTYEFAANNRLVSLERPQSTDPSINIDNATIEVAAEGGEGILTVQYENITDIAAEVYFCDAEGEAATYDWVSATINSSNNVEYSINANEGAARTAYFKVYALDDEANDVYSNLVTVNQAAYVAPFEGGTYTLATSIEEGRIYIIVGKDGEDAYAMGDQNNNNRGAVGISIDDNTATVEEGIEAYEFYIESLGEGSLYCIYDFRKEGFLYAASSNSNHLKTKAGLDDNGKWAITFNQDGVASIVAQGTNSHNVMQYNSGSTLFSCYASDSQNPVYLYVKEEETPEPETYELTINGYTDAESKAGYYLIASPVTVNIADVAGLTEGDFDLYSYDESQELEWINYKQEDGSHPFTTLEPGKGYLYAKKATAETPTYTFTLTGTPYDGTPIVLSKQSTGTLAGWNLIGNPSATSNIAPGRAFYIMNSTIGELIASESSTVEPKQGFFVIATEDGEEFEWTAPMDGNLGKVVMNLSRNRGTVVDRAIVRFGEGDQLPKFQLNPNNTKIYFAQADNDYAVVRSANEGEMPVSFRAAENGTYTLSIETENVKMDYLHLIDNMTGMDIDLLATPSYSFEARKNDYTSRFRLVFSANGIDEQNAETFAFFNGSEWMVSNLGESTLQVVDVMGRVLSTETISGNAELSLNQPAGVYMLRLINGNDVKVQKVIVK